MRLFTAIAITLLICATPFVILWRRWKDLRSGPVENGADQLEDMDAVHVAGRGRGL